MNTHCYSSWGSLLTGLILKRYIISKNGLSLWTKSEDPYGQIEKGLITSYTPCYFISHTWDTYPIQCEILHLLIFHPVHKHSNHILDKNSILLTFETGTMIWHIPNANMALQIWDGGGRFLSWHVYFVHIGVSMVDKTYGIEIHDTQLIYSQWYSYNEQWHLLIIYSGKLKGGTRLGKLGMTYPLSLSKRC